MPDRETMVSIVLTTTWTRVMGSGQWKVGGEYRAVEQLCVIDIMKMT